MNLNVALFEANIGEPFGACPALGLLEHRGRQIHPEYGAGACSVCRGPGRQATSAPDVEDAICGADRRGLHEVRVMR